MSEHSAHLTSLPFGFRTWLWRYTCLLLLISMLWHRQAIFESKGDKLSSSAESRIRSWKHFPRYWPLVRVIHRSAVNFPHESQWRGALMFALICAWINGCANNRRAGDLRRNRPHYDVPAYNIPPPHLHTNLYSSSRVLYGHDYFESLP